LVEQRLQGDDVCAQAFDGVIHDGSIEAHRKHRFIQA
jgi:hypothetical protein